MYLIYDRKRKEYTTKRPHSIYSNAVRIAQMLNITNEGIEEIDKPEQERRYVIKEV